MSAGVGGRIALSSPNGPHIVPVNYSVVDDAIIVRTSPYSVLGTYGRDSMLAFEVDQFDYERQHGWSVVARGRGEVVVDPDELEHIRAHLGAAAVGRAGSRDLHLRLRWTELTGRRIGTGWDLLDDTSRPSDGLTGAAHWSACPATRLPPASSRALLEAVTAISSDLDLHSRARPGSSRRRPADARRGTARSGVIGSDAFLVEFVTTGLTDEERGRDRRPAPRARHPRAAHPPPGAAAARRPHPAPAVRGLPAEPPADGHLPRRAGPDPRHRLRQPLPDREGRRAVVHREDELLVEALASAAGFVIDNARAYGLSERRRQWLEASAELSEALQPPIELERALDRGGPRRARRCRGATAAAVRRLADGIAGPHRRGRAGRRSATSSGPGRARRRALAAARTRRRSTSSSATSTPPWCRCAPTWSAAGCW